MWTVVQTSIPDKWGLTLQMRLKVLVEGNNSTQRKGKDGRDIAHPFFSLTAIC